LTCEWELLLLNQLIARSAGKLKDQVGPSGYLLIRLITVFDPALWPGLFFASFFLAASG